VDRIDVARIHGDEFGVVLHGLTADVDLPAITRALLHRITEPVTLYGLTVHTSVSIGLVSRLTDDRPEDLIRDADTAMYQAKTAGGGRCVTFDTHMQSQTVRRLQLENDLYDALARGEFRVVYQPIVSLESGAIEGFEALVRWAHPEKGMIPPDQFIPVAEETGLIVPIGMFVLHQALNQLSELGRQFPHLDSLWVSVNLSKRQLIEENLVQSVQRALRESAIPPRRLKLEVTESVVMEHAEAITPVLVSLSEIGVRLAMDDFGTGHSSLSCLHRFPLDCLKVDRAFINTMGMNRQYAAIVHAVVTLAHNLGMVVVAEGIESIDQVALLRSLECGLGQGFLFSKPLPPSELPALLMQRRAPLAPAALAS
jgi:EAL domain-containing protein (putative c-di-GMP-specific phosphodiesterase class I)